MTIHQLRELSPGGKLSPNGESSSGGILSAGGQLLLDRELSSAGGTDRELSPELSSSNNCQSVRNYHSVSSLGDPICH